MDLKRYAIKKPVAQVVSESESGQLKRTLGAKNLVSLGIGCVIGAGIFVMTGQAAAAHAGPAIMISFILAGFAAAMAALCYAELASMLPVSGSAYSYAYVSLGEIFAWIMGWLLILEYGTAAATVAVGWSGYLVSFLGSQLGIVITPELTFPYGVEMVNIDGSWKELTPKFAESLVASGIDVDSLRKVTGLFNLPAFLGISAVTALLIVGVRESANVNNFIVLIKVSVILVFIGVGAFYVNPDNWKPFIPENTGHDGEYGYSGVLKAAGVIFFAYIGFEAVSTAAQETRNPQRNVPIGILGSLVICTLLYILVSGVLTGIVPYKTLNVPDPMAVAVDQLGIGWLAVVVKIGAIMGLSSVMLVLVYGQTRVFFAMSRDGLIPAFFSTVHKKFQTPHLNTLFVGTVIAFAAGLVPLRTLGDLVSAGTLFAFSIICFSVLYLRYKQPEQNRPFKVPLYPVIPILGIIACLYLMYGLRHTFWTLKFYFLAGLVVYFVYGQFRSKLVTRKEK